MQRYQGLFDYWSKERQRLRSLEPSESSDSLEFLDESNIIGLTEQSQLLMELLKEYKYQFKSIFESLHVDYNNENMVNTATTRQDNFNVNFGGSSTMEASRSTGY